MIPVLSVALMRASDAQTIESGTPSRELMRRAGEGLVDAVDRSGMGGWRPPVAIVCGSGNNAGDGYVVAAILARRGIACTVFLLSDRFSEDGAFFADEARAAGVPMAITTASFIFASQSAEPSRPTSRSVTKRMPMASRIVRRRSIKVFSSLKQGMPYLRSPPMLARRS